LFRKSSGQGEQLILLPVKLPFQAIMFLTIQVKVRIFYTSGLLQTACRSQERIPTQCYIAHLRPWFRGAFYFLQNLAITVRGINAKHNRLLA